MTSSLLGFEMREEWVKYVEYVPKSFSYLIVLVTSVSTQSSSDRFLFIKTFNNEVGQLHCFQINMNLFIKVWMVLFISIIFMSFIMYLVDNYKDWAKSYMLTLGTLLSQSIKKLNYISENITTINSLSKSIVIVSFGIWIVMSLILSRAFSGKMLTGMFTFSVIPFIETLEDLAHNSKIEIYPFGDFNDKLKLIEPKLFEKLEPRIKEGMKTSIKTSQVRGVYLQIAKSIDKRQGVILGIEDYCKPFIYRYSPEYPNLYISPHKYFFAPLSLIISRKFPQILAR